ncbi:cyclase family protein [Streptomyces sp. NBC_00356]|uniref:cyclase family protein n=1 Tax=Streptomyces sp. NBC_00356 TaxID=2975724 RepID=UPI002E263B7B
MTSAPNTPGVGNASTLDLAAALATGSVRVVDLTAPLSSGTPILPLPEPMHPIPHFELERLNDWDDPGEISFQNHIHTGEHVGTHFDAPVHWSSGRDLEDVGSVPAARLVGPAAVVDKSAECAKDPDHLLSLDELKAWEREHGALPEGGWLVYRTGWDTRSDDQAAFLNADDNGPHTPGLTPECARYLAEETGIVGIGVETVGTDAGQAFRFEPPFPVHHFMLGNGKYGVTQLRNVGELPPVGAVLVVAPLRIVGGSGSPARVLALTPAAEGK